jgi:NAD(P)-dependent dehydrogenase (short-subunit alcohol dehydrogenase family)
MERLAKRVAIVTGAASGIGRAIALIFASEGAQLELIDFNGPELEKTVRLLRGGEAHARAWEVDLANGPAAERTISQITAKTGRVDVLVNNAACYCLQSLNDVTLTEWGRILDTNLTAYFLCARIAARAMRERGGSIVNISSVHRIITEPNSAAYAASKGGVSQLTRSLAVELGPDDVVVNSITPGFIRTAMSIVNGVDETTTEHFANYYVNSGRIPLRRAGLPDEIGAAALFLASRECAYLTGADLVVDGGLTITL